MIGIRHLPNKVVNPICFFSVESLTLRKIYRLTNTQGIEIIKTYYKNVDFATASYRALRGDYGLYNRPTTPAIGKILKKFEKTVVATNIERPVHCGFARSAEYNAIVSEIRCECVDSSAYSGIRTVLRYDTLWRTHTSI